MTKSRWADLRILGMSAIALGISAVSCDDGGDGRSDPTDAGGDTDTDAGGNDLSNTKACQEAMEKKSTIGCEYWAADLDNAQNLYDTAAAGQFAVVVANTGGAGIATVEVHINEAPQGEPLSLKLVETASIPQNSLHVFELPRRDVDSEHKKEGVDDGPQTWLSSRAFRIASDTPVVAYQFNTLDQQYSNDTSLLIPTSGLGKDHIVLGFPPSGPYAPVTKNRGYVTVLGVKSGTTVEVTPTFDIMGGEGVGSLAKGSKGTFTIGPFDVLNLETRLLSQGEIGNVEPDLTGTTVRSDKPVAVFFGTDLSMVQKNKNAMDDCCAEHLEEQIIPSEAMGYEFVVSHSAQRNSGEADNAEFDYYRILSYSDGAYVTTSLEGKNASFSLNRGQYKELYSKTGFTVTSTKPLHVAQFLVIGTETNTRIGDPSLLYVPAVQQRRSLYVFCTGEGFSHNAAVISMPQGTTALLDGADIRTSEACRGPLTDGGLGGVLYESWTCDIEDGVHMVHSEGSPETAKTPIGVFVYGYYEAGSYSYPAGSDLLDINEDIAV